MSLKILFLILAVMLSSCGKDPQGSGGAPAAQVSIVDQHTCAEKYYSPVFDGTNYTTHSFDISLTNNTYSDGSSKQTCVYVSGDGLVNSLECDQPYVYTINYSSGAVIWNSGHTAWVYNYDVTQTVKIDPTTSSGCLVQ